MTRPVTRPVTRPMLGLIAGLILGLSACQTAGPEKEGLWASDELTTASERILWNVTVLSLEKHGFPVGSGVDPTTMMATSGWQNNLAPFRGEGYRERAIVRYEPLGSGHYRVEVRVEHQKNMDLTRPLDARYAKWEAGPDDLEEAGVILQRIKAWIGDEFEVGDRPEPSSPP